MHVKDISESTKLTQTNTLMPSSYDPSLINAIKDNFKSQTESLNNDAVNSKCDAIESEISSLSSRKSKRDKADLFLHVISHTVAYTSLFSFNPIFPMEAESKGINSFLINLIFGTYYFFVLLSSPLFGYLLPTLGPTFVSSSSLLAMGSVMVLLGAMHYSPSGTYFVVMMVACRAVLGVCGSAFTTANLASTINKHPKNKNLAIACVRSGATIGKMAGSFFGGVLYDLGGYQFPFFVIGLITIIMGIISLKFVIKVTVQQHNPRSLKETMHTLLHLFRSPLASIAFAAAIIRGSSSANLISTLTLHVLPLGVSVSTIALLFLADNISEVLANVLGGYMCSKFQERSWMISLGHLMLIVAYVLLSPSFFFPLMDLNIWMILTALILFGLACGITTTPCLRMVLQGAEEVGLEDNIDIHSLISGLQLFLLTFGRMLGQLGMGMFQASTGIDSGYNLFVLMHIIVVIVALILFVVRSKNARLDRLGLLSLSSSCSTFQR